MATIGRLTGGALLFGQIDADADPSTDMDLWLLDLRDGASPASLMSEPYRETQPTLSPGGDYIAYQSARLGYQEVFVHSLPELRGNWMISTADIAPWSGITNADIRDD